MATSDCWSISPTLAVLKMHVWHRGYRVADMVCAGCIGNTPEILEVSILILYSDVLLNAWSVVGLWQCCISRPVTVAMVSCSLMWLLFLSCFWWTVHYGSRTRNIFMKRSYSSALSLTDLTNSFWCCQYPIPIKAYCLKVSSRAATWDHYQHFLWDVLKMTTVHLP